MQGLTKTGLLQCKQVQFLLYGWHLLIKVGISLSEQFASPARLYYESRAGIPAQAGCATDGKSYLPENSERNHRKLPSFISYKLLEACRESGCPLCRLEQQAIERYLDNQFYEHVNSPAWRDHLRASHAFCHEHAWLAVNKRLGDALGFSLIYHDIANNILNQLGHAASTTRAPRRRASLPLRTLIEKTVAILTPRKRCPVCEHRDQSTHNILSALIEAQFTSEMTEALQASDGLCLPHLRLALAEAKDPSVYESLLAIHRTKLESLRDELAEFIRKNDYQVIKEGFGKEGDAWQRAIGTIVGHRRE